MKPLLLFLISAVSLAVGCAPCAAETFRAETPLATAVERFNARAQLEAVGKTEPPLTVDETVAAIRGWIRKQRPIPDRYWEAFQKVADTLTLPAGSRLDFATRWRNYNGYDFVVWWIHLSINDPEATSTDPATVENYTLQIRDRKISSRPASGGDIPSRIETRVSNAVAQADGQPETGAAPAAEEPKVDSENDHQKIQGTWKVTSAHDSGDAPPPDVLKDLKWRISKNKISYTFGDKVTEWTYKLDPARKPKWIDLSEGTRTALGIYELEDDNLRICFPEGRQGERSTAFESKPNSANDILIILKRE
jgi:uncharacterized protein (TIGR03067 family)